MKKYTSIFKKKMILLYTKGNSVSKLSKAYKASRSTIYRWIHHNHSLNIVSVYTKQDKENAISLYQKQVPVKQISNKLKISKSTLYVWFHLYKLNHKKTIDKYANDLHVKKLKSTIEVLKLLSPIKHLKSREKFEIIKPLSKRYSITLLCEVFNISKNTYYRYLNRKLTLNELRDNFLREEILDIYKSYRKMIGGIKIKKALNERGLRVSKRKVYQIMNELNICKQTKKTNPYLRPKKKTNSKCKNILKQRFNPLEPNLVWVSDITEVKIKSKPVYLCVIIDLFARKVIGYIISIKNNTRLTELTFKNALVTRYGTPPVMFHSDRGSNFTSYHFRQLIQKHHTTQSFSKPGYPYDNSPMESFFSQFKRETKQERDSICTIKAYRKLVKEYIDFYNEFRFHMGIGLLSPNKKEELYYNFYIKNSKPLK